MCLDPAGFWPNCLDFKVFRSQMHNNGVWKKERKGKIHENMRCLSVLSTQFDGHKVDNDWSFNIDGVEMNCVCVVEMKDWVCCCCVQCSWGYPRAFSFFFSFPKSRFSTHFPAGPVGLVVIIFLPSP